MIEFLDWVYSSNRNFLCSVFFVCLIGAFLVGIATALRGKP